MEQTRDGKKTYQVWQWRENPHGFPNNFTHVADVQANGLKEVIELTRDTGGLFDDSQSWLRWQEKDGVTMVAGSNREMMTGDVIVDPSGDGYQLRYSSVSYSRGQPVYDEQEFFERVTPRQPEPSEYDRRLQEAADHGMSLLRDTDRGRDR